MKMRVWLELRVEDFPYRLEKDIKISHPEGGVLPDDVVADVAKTKMAELIEERVVTGFEIIPETPEA